MAGPTRNASLLSYWRVVFAHGTESNNVTHILQIPLPRVGYREAPRGKACLDGPKDLAESF